MVESYAHSTWAHLTLHREPKVLVKYFPTKTQAIQVFVHVQIQHILLPCHGIMFLR